MKKIAILIIVLLLTIPVWGIIALLDSEPFDQLDISSIKTILTDTPDASNDMLCQAYIVLGSAADPLDGTGGAFEFVMTIGGQAIQPSPQIAIFGTEVRASIWTSQFLVPTGEVVIIQVTSPNAADTTVDVTAYLYDVFPVNTASGVIESNVKELDGSAVQQASGYIKVSDGTGTGQLDLTAGGVLLADVDHTINKLSITATTGTALSIGSGGGNAFGVSIIGNGSGGGVRVMGGTTGIGVEIIGGTTSGSAMKVWADGTNDYGFEIVGLGNKAGMSVTGGATGRGMEVSAGGGSTDGAKFTGNGSGNGVTMQGGDTGDGLFAQGGDTSGAGAHFKGANDGGGDGIKAESSDDYGFLITGNTGDIEASEINSILADTNELQIDWADDGRLDVILDAIKAYWDSLTITGGLLEVVHGNI